jgi:hypothetical protein
MPRSARALLSLVLLALIFAGAARASAGHRVLASTPAVCPVISGIPCCQIAVDPSIIPCCQPTIIKCPGLLTISSWRDPSSARQAVKISGRLMTAGSTGATVTLWQELPGHAGFHQVAQTNTDSAGAYTFTRRAGSVQTNRSWYVTALGMKSVTVTQMVRAAVSLTVAAQKSSTGERVMFKGQVTPSHCGEAIHLQERSASGWKLIASVRLTASSTFLLRESFLGSGPALVRAALGADSRNIASHSPTVKTKL